MYDYMTKYKCRLCGKVFSASFINNKIINKFSNHNKGLKLRNGYKNKVLYHCCEDGSVGIADFVGFKNDKLEN